MVSIIRKNRRQRKLMEPIMVDTASAFRTILDEAAFGQKIIYYEGDLMYDRSPFGSRDTAQRMAINQIGLVAYEAARAEKVCLFQKRLGPNRWQYQAIVC